MPDADADAMTRHMVKVLNALGEDPNGTQQHDNWAAVQEPGCLNPIPKWFIVQMDLRPSSVKHLDDDVPPQVLETARALFVERIRAGQAVQFRAVPSGEFRVELETETGEDVIAIHTPRPAEEAAAPA